MVYENMADDEIIKLILAGNEEAALYLIYDRYAGDIRYKAGTFCYTFRLLHWRDGSDTGALGSSYGQQPKLF